ncbi:MAG: flagellar biosynthesis anti-sigma factor FlgM [Bdellovibrionales bacterium]|nr:flagellar biosynthesis anti-sigma factor FlgM [Bdellovibrionales bacterium]
MGMNCGSKDASNGQPARKRSLTSLTLEWITEKLRRSEQIKEDIKSGSYQIDSEKLAARLANEE